MIHTRHCGDLEDGKDCSQFEKPDKCTKTGKYKCPNAFDREDKTLTKTHLGKKATSIMAMNESMGTSEHIINDHIKMVVNNE